MIAIAGVALACLLILCLVLGDDWQSGFSSFITIAVGGGIIWFLVDWMVTP